MIKNHMKDSLLMTAMEAYKKGRKELYVSMCEDALKLLRYQRDLDEKFGVRNKFANKSIHETCRLLLEQNELKLAEKFKNDYKIPDKRFWWLRILTLAKSQNWIELEKFSKVKKSPIGYAPFVDVCLQNDSKREALKYLSRVSEDLKVKYYIKAGDLEEAAKIAFEQRDLQMLIHIQGRCHDPVLREKVNNFVIQLEPKM